jgi:hypothetical protein
VDTSGNVFLGGGTSSIDFPVTAGAFQKVNKASASAPNPYLTGFVTKLALGPLNNQVVLSKNILSFGDEMVGESTGELSVDVTNDSYSALPFSSILLTGSDAASFATSNTCGTSLGSGETCTIGVHFAPVAAGALAATITLTDSAANSPQIITLSGTGTAPFALSSASLSFGAEALGYSTPAQGVTLTNNTNSAFVIVSIKLTGADATSFVTSNTCGTSLAAGATCRFGVRFVPVALGAANAAVTVTDSAPNSPQSVALSGTGISAPQASLSLSSSGLSFSSTPAGESTGAQNVTVTNTGSSATVFFKSIALVGANSSSFVTSNTCGGKLGGSLAPGATCRIGVRFVPQAAGLLSASITLTDNAAGSSQTISLNGTGIGALVTLSSTSISFGSEPVGDSTNAQAITVTNSGYLPLDIGSIRLTGPGVTSFVTSNTCGASLAMGAACRIGVRFVPSANSTASAAVTLTDNAPDSPQGIALSGTGVTAPAASLSLSANSMAFAEEPVGSSTGALDVIVTNTSTTATLYFQTIALGGANASSFVTSNTCNGASGGGLGGSLAPGAQCRIGARFAPTVSGPLSATITVTGNAANSPQAITLTGTGN